MRAYGFSSVPKTRQARYFKQMSGFARPRIRTSRSRLAANAGSAWSSRARALVAASALAAACSGQKGETSEGEVRPSDDRFTAFVFKVQANMDPPHRDRIAIVYLDPGGVGRCRAGNFALAAASGEWISYLDDDDLYAPEHLETIHQKKQICR